MSVARRSFALAAVAAMFFVALAATRPEAKGLTYRLRMTTRLPAMMAQMSGDAAGPVVLAKVKSIGGRARFEFQAAPPGVGPDDYVLFDSVSAVFVNAAEKTYAEAPAAFGGSGGALGMLGGMARRGRAGGGNAPQMEITGLVTDLQELDGDTLQGRQVRRYQLVAEMNVQVMNTMAPLRVEMQMWTADLPYQIVNPFDLDGTVSPDDPAAKFTSKLIELRRKIRGTPLKTITSMTISGLGNGALPPIEFQQTTAITDIVEADVDPKELALPAGFTKRTPGGN